MPKFSKTSTRRLKTCHKDLQILFNHVVKEFDCSILCGFRNKDDQNKALKEGKSKLAFPNSKHNKTPKSLAVDVAPWPLSWYQLDRFYFFAGYVLGCARELGIKVRFGGDWDRDFDIKDQNFNDLPHWELIGD